MKANILKRPPLGVCAIFAGFTLLAGASAAQTETPQPEIPKWQQSLEQEMAGSQSQEWTGNIKEELKEWEQREAERKELERQEQAWREEQARQERLAQEEAERQERLAQQAAEEAERQRDFEREQERKRRNAEIWTNTINTLGQQIQTYYEIKRRNEND